MKQNSTRVDYPEALRTLGYIIQREHMSEVSITEFDRGWVITGLTFRTTMQGFIRVPKSLVLSYEEVRTVTEDLTRQRQRESPVRRGWLR